MKLLLYTVEKQVLDLLKLHSTLLLLVVVFLSELHLPFAASI